MQIVLDVKAGAHWMLMHKRIGCSGTGARDPSVCTELSRGCRAQPGTATTSAMGEL